MQLFLREVTVVVSTALKLQENVKSTRYGRITKTYKFLKTVTISAFHYFATSDIAVLGIMTTPLAVSGIGTSHHDTLISAL